MDVSFRDPSGRVYIFEDEIIRCVRKEAVSDFELLLESNVLRSFTAAGELVDAEKLNKDQEIFFSKKLDLPDGELIVRHPKIPFINYPFEWSPQMLYSAAKLTLEFSKKLLRENIGLKDASPYNIVFSGKDPVFVDWLSFEYRDPVDYIWLPQAQFIRNFILPLLVNSRFGVPLNQIFISRRDGLEPDDVYKMSGGIQKLSSPFLSVVSLPKWLSAKEADYEKIQQPKKSASRQKSAFILENQFGRLEKWLDKSFSKNKSNAASPWTDYFGKNQHFSEAYLKQKSDFVTDVLAQMMPDSILDVGSNTGHFSRIAASSGARVLAIDADQSVVDRVWQTASDENLNILPLVVDFSRPSPSIGWKNKECISFIDRVRGRVDGILMLAVIHHLLVSERIPLDEILDLCAEITKKFVVIEFIAPSDKMFRKISRGRDHLHRDLTCENFEKACRKYFSISRREKMKDAERWLYLLEK